MIKVLIFSGYYYPSTKSGGPLISVRNMINITSDKIQFYVLANDRDIGEKKPYINITHDTWTTLDNHKVMYLNEKKINFRNIKKVVNNLKPDFIYLNSLFSFKWSLIPIIIFHKKNLILAPRGNLSIGAMSLKSIKKKTFILFFKRFLVRKIYNWHFTSEIEFLEAKRYINKFHNYKIISNITLVDDLLENRRAKKTNQLNLIYFGRIHPKKNIHFALKAMENTTIPISLDIYGPIEDKQYYNQLVYQINRMSSIHKVEYKGFFNNSELGNFINNYDFFIFPTLGENYGHSIIESIAFGLPVIISDKTPWNHLDGKIGYVVDINKTDKLSKKLEEVYQMDSEKWFKLSVNAKDSYRKIMDLEKIKKQYYELFI